MKRYLIISLLFTLFLSIPVMADDVINDDDCIEKVLSYYADSLAKVSYTEVQNHLDDLGYEYTTILNSDDIAQFKISCENGGMTIMFYPTTDDESSYGNPSKEMLSIIEYSTGTKWVSVSDELHTSDTVFSTGDESRKPVNKKVSNLESLLEYYRSEIKPVSMQEGIPNSSQNSSETELQESITEASDELTKEDTEADYSSDF